MKAVASYTLSRAVTYSKAATIYTKAPLQLSLIRCLSHYSRQNTHTNRLNKRGLNLTILRTYETEKPTPKASLPPKQWDGMNEEMKKHGQFVLLLLFGFALIFKEYIEDLYLLSLVQEWEKRPTLDKRD